jgi:hypothetical protein
MKRAYIVSLGAAKAGSPALVAMSTEPPFPGKATLT